MVSEKATIDRQLKALQAQTGKLTKVTQTSTEYNNDIEGFSARAGLGSTGQAGVVVQHDASSFAWSQTRCSTSKHQHMTSAKEYLLQPALVHEHTTNNAIFPWCNVYSVGLCATIAE